jgi:hypothetical protein
MDSIAHALYGGLVTEHKKLFFWGMFFGALPDIITSLVAFFTNGIAGVMTFAFTDANTLSPAVYTTYYATHSFLCAAILALTLYLIDKKLIILAVPYLLHILFDIPFHCGLYGTRFLYPVNNLHVCGYSYGDHLWLWGINYAVLLVLYVGYFGKFKKRTQKQKDSSNLHNRA